MPWDCIEPNRKTQKVLFASFHLHTPTINLVLYKKIGGVFKRRPPNFLLYFINNILRIALKLPLFSS